MAPLSVAQADAGDDAVGAAGEFAEHPCGGVAVSGLAEDVLSADDDCIGGDEDLAGLQGTVESFGFRNGQCRRYLVRL